MPVRKFLGDLARAARSGVVQLETEQHIRYSFRTIGRSGDLPACMRVIDEHCTRLANEITKLRELQRQLTIDDQPVDVHPT